VDQLVKKAVAAGGAHAMEPQDHGFMYAWSFYDPDGHHWEVFWILRPQYLGIGGGATTSEASELPVLRRRQGHLVSWLRSTAFRASPFPCTPRPHDNARIQDPKKTQNELMNGCTKVGGRAHSPWRPGGPG
jgi:hypothetical protein